MIIWIRHTNSSGKYSRHVFRELDKAIEFATNKVGPHPKIAEGHAWSDDGVGKLYVAGDVTLRAIFPHCF